eukprot:scaffold96289_cov48-Phaeocystis_antarctica.AAC.1
MSDYTDTTLFRAVSSHHISSVLGCSRWAVGGGGGRALSLSTRGPGLGMRAHIMLPRRRTTAGSAPELAGISSQQRRASTPQGDEGRVPRSPSISRHASSGEHEAEGRGAKADRISRRELRRPLELDAVEESAVGGAEVAEEEQAVTTLDLRRR